MVGLTGTGSSSSGTSRTWRLPHAQSCAQGKENRKGDGGKACKIQEGKLKRQREGVMGGTPQDEGGIRLMTAFPHSLGHPLPLASRHPLQATFPERLHDPGTKRNAPRV